MTTWSARSCPAARSPSPADFNTQLQAVAGRGRTPGSAGRWAARPTDRIAADRAAMLALPPVRADDRVAGLDPAAA